MKGERVFKLFFLLSSTRMVFVLRSVLWILLVSVTISTTSLRMSLVVHTSEFVTQRMYSFQEIVGHLERQYDDILAEESRIKRNPRFRDNRAHALLYFIPPTGHA